MKRLFLAFIFAIVTSGAIFLPAQDAQAWWDDDDDYWDRPWYGGGVNLGGRGHRRQRHTVADSFGHGDHVRIHIVLIQSPEFTGTTESADHFVVDPEDP